MKCPPQGEDFRTDAGNVRHRNVGTPVPGCPRLSSRGKTDTPGGVSLRVKTGGAAAKPLPPQALPLKKGRATSPAPCGAPSPKGRATSPAPCGGTLPKGEGISLPPKGNVGHRTVGAGYNPPTAVGGRMQPVQWKPPNCGLDFTWEVDEPGRAGHDPPLQTWISFFTNINPRYRFRCRGFCAQCKKAQKNEAKSPGIVEYFH